jgi:murein DD-endopeptidase MepM/ murein hydrolase activator NlpD
VHLAHEGGPSAAAVRSVHRERGGWRAYDQIPKLPDRPSPYDSYVWPLESATMSSAYDLDAPDEKQRRLRSRPETGHGGWDLMASRGTPVHVVPLEGQDGETRVIYTGPLFGTTVVTAHRVKSDGGASGASGGVRIQTYVVLYGHLDSVAAGIAAGQNAANGTMIGSVGDSGSPGIVHLHLEVRRLREGVDLARLAAGPGIISEAMTVPCDPRNVLPLRGQQETSNPRP